MHVGNCTDGSADYQLSGDGLIVEPPGITEEVSFRLETETQNYLDAGTNSFTVTFDAGNGKLSVDGVTNDDLALLTECNGVLTALKVARVPLQPVP